MRALAHVHKYKTRRQARKATKKTIAQFLPFSRRRPRARVQVIHGFAHLYHDVICCETQREVRGIYVWGVHAEKLVYIPIGRARRWVGRVVLFGSHIAP